MLNFNSKIYVAGHRGMVGSAIVRRLNALGYSNIVVRTHAELDLCNQAAVDEFFRDLAQRHARLVYDSASELLANDAEELAA